MLLFCSIILFTHLPCSSFCEIGNNENTIDFRHEAQNPQGMDKPYCSQNLQGMESFFFFWEKGIFWGRLSVEDFPEEHGKAGIFVKIICGSREYVF